jgi:geranylgeranyl reductase family protein
MDSDLIVVGGGPVGSRVAALTAKSMRTLVLEEHEKVGTPVQCAGLVTPRVVEMAGAEGTVLNRINGGVVHFPGGISIKLNGKETKAVVVDRRTFDIASQEMALDAGAEFITGTRFTSFFRDQDSLNVEAVSGGEKRTLRANLLVGTDGYKSCVGRAAGIGQSRDMVRGIQADIDRKLDDQDCIQVYLGQEIAPGFFAWMIPCGDFTRVGLCVSKGHGAPSSFLSSFLKTVGLGDAERLNSISGIIPIGPPQSTYADRVMVVGDAAAQAKPLSGGGLYTGMVAAECASRTAIESLEGNDFSSRMMSRYQERWRSEIGKELDKGYRIRKVFVRLNDRKIDEVGRLMNRRDVLEILSQGDIDYPSRLAPSILRSIPSLLKFSPQILGSLLGK